MIYSQSLLDLDTFTDMTLATIFRCSSFLALLQVMDKLVDVILEPLWQICLSLT